VSSSGSEQQWHRYVTATLDKASAPGTWQASWLGVNCHETTTLPGWLLSSSLHQQSAACHGLPHSNPKSA
jgi:hypothetical protein